MNAHLTIQRLKRELQARNAVLEHQLKVAQDLLSDAKKRVDGPLLGSSSAVRDLNDQIAARAASSEPIRWTGPPGAGQEAVARAIHHGSDRSKCAFIYLNCALRSAGTDLVVSVAERADSNTAMEERKFEVARGGTLFLAGIDRLRPDRQQRLIEMIRG